jgi:hypothetical protein
VTGAIVSVGSELPGTVGAFHDWIYERYESRSQSYQALGRNEEALTDYKEALRFYFGPNGKCRACRCQKQ